MTPTNWLPGVLALAVALVSAVVFVLFGRKRGPEMGEASPLLEHEQRYRILLTQLQELHAERDRLTDAQFTQEMARLELAAAAALREKDQTARSLKHEAEKTEARLARQQAASTSGWLTPQLKGALWGAGAVLFFGGLGLLLSREATPRAEDGAPTGGTGGPMQAGGNNAADADPELHAALQAAAHDPENVERLAEAARELLRRQRFEEAEQYVDRAQNLDPYHLPTRIYRAVVRATRGEGGDALRELEHLARTYPGSEDALLWGGAVAAEVGQRAKALEMFERYAATVPRAEQPPMLQAGIARLRAELGR